MKPIILATDLIVYLLFAFLIYLLFAVRRETYLQSAWLQIRKNKVAMVSMVIILLYGGVALLDSVRWRDRVLDDAGNPTLTENGEFIYSGKALSALDRIFIDLKENSEKTFSAPFATHQYTKEIITFPDGTVKRDYPPLKYPGSHWLGTDKVGNDVLFAAIKGIRTGIVIGAGASMLAIPFAIFFGVVAGFFGGWIDDIIQYIYTTLSSIPGVLLIVAFMLIFGQEGYQGGLITERDLTIGPFVLNDRLFWLCAIMGLTSWTGLCRLLRGETLKLRELEYIQAAKAFGVRNLSIIYKHIVPNVMHIVLITSILQFSGLVLAEAILSYIGIGVGAEMGSWGNMINTARLELSREPVVWWNLLAAFIFMFALVLPANIFGDAVRDALDPRLRTK
jgi:ABC-type dipeptide/oligopeptide/nickel transport system permease subunit